ncbi:MAG: SIR2 family protein [Phycisphaerales bacterium]
MTIDPTPARGSASQVPSDKSLSLRRMDSQEFINRLKGVCDSVHQDNPSSDSRYAFFLGAGCSVSSGIPAAGALVRDSWIPRLCKIKAPQRTDYAAFAKEQFPGYDPDRASSFYGQLIDALFITPNDRQREIEQLCEGKFPGFGYAALSKLVAHKSTAFNVVLTTNFDDLMADALYLYTEARPLVIHHESLAAFIRPTRMRPLVVKLHGDSRLSPKNTREETEDLGENLAKHIAMLLNDRGLIFMG